MINKNSSAGKLHISIFIITSKLKILTVRDLLFKSTECIFIIEYAEYALDISIFKLNLCRQHMMFFSIYPLGKYSVACDRRWFSPSTPVSSTNKTDNHDITEILLKVGLSIIPIQNCVSQIKG